MPNDLIRLYCKGTGKRFRGDPCGHYDLFTDECHLLRQGKTASVFDQGRCEPAKTLKNAVERYLFKYRKLVYGKPEDHYKYKDEYIDFISDRLIEIFPFFPQADSHQGDR